MSAMIIKIVKKILAIFHFDLIRFALGLWISYILALSVEFFLHIKLKIYVLQLHATQLFSTGFNL